MMNTQNIFVNIARTLQADGLTKDQIRSAFQKQYGLSPAEADAAIAETPGQPAAAQPQTIDPLPKVPAYLKRIPIHWSLETGDNGKPTKIPYRIDGGKAASTRPEDWSDYCTAITGVKIDQTQGVGFVVNGGIVGFDLDGCRDPKTDKLADWAEQIIDALDSYTEITPSQMGVRVWVRGKLPGTDKVFNLDPAVGFGDKVKIEVFTDSRYFTVTGDSYFEESGDVEERDLTAVYQMLHDIRAKYPVPKSQTEHQKESAADSAESTKIELLGTFSTNKYEIFMRGEIESRGPFVVSNRIGRLTYPSQSEADMAFATVLAIMHDGDEQKIDEDLRNSVLYRPKWERDDYRNNTIAKAIESATKIKPNSVQAVVQPTVFQAVGERLPQDNTDEFSEASIPAFDASVIKGIYKEIVDETTRGTTLSPQFIYAIAKAIVGAKMTGKVKFADLDVEPLTYLINCGPTGSGKGEAWRRMLKILIAKLSGEMLISNPLSCNAGIKILNSADSGAGLRDAFFEHPADQPIVCYVDEVKSLGHKAGEKKNPEILDVMGELADSTSLSRVKARKWVKQPSAKTKNDAYLAVVMCVQNSEVITSAFTGRTGVGWYDRLIPEYGVPQEPGDLPPISNDVATSLLRKLNGLPYSGMMMMTLEAKAHLEQFWANQTPEIRIVARLKQHLKLDAYLIAFGRGSKIEVHGNTLTRMVELSDVEDAIKNFPRQLAIRRVLFRGEVPNRVGFYLAGIKGLTEWMRRRLAEGISEALVARSWRDYELKTNARRNNEEDIFARAMETHARHHLRPVDIQAKNGHTYRRYLPLPEDE